jgi:hypothetical protein
MCDYVHTQDTYSVDVMLCGVQEAMAQHRLELNKIHSNLLRMVTYVRTSPQPDTVELEMRTGVIQTNGSFQTGYTVEYKDVVQRLMKRLGQQVTQFPAHWTSKPQYIFMVADFSAGVRKIICNGKSTYLKKTPMEQLNVVTDRPQDIRFALSQESPILLGSNHHLFKTLARSTPTSVRIVQRASFFERVSDRFSFRYDISKVSPRSSTKYASVHEAKCMYHVELELLCHKPDKSCSSTPAPGPMSDEDVVKRFLTRSFELLGTHTVSLDKTLTLIDSTNVRLLQQRALQQRNAHAARKR